MFSLRNVYKNRGKFRVALLQSNIDNNIIGKLDDAKNRKEYMEIIIDNLALIYNLVPDFRISKDIKINFRKYNIGEIKFNDDLLPYDFHYSDDFLSYNEFECYEGKQISLNNEFLK